MGILNKFKGSNFEEKKQGNNINPKGNLLSRSSILKPHSPIKNKISPSIGKVYINSPTVYFFDNVSIVVAVNLWTGTPTEKQQALKVYGEINTWNTTQVTDMSRLFQGKESFNDDISNWDVRNVTNMHEMFYDATSFNGDIGAWNVGNVTNIKAMFRNANAFNQDIGSWDVSSVTNMNYVFSGATSFNGDISSWDVSNVIAMTNMFSGATSFNQNISGWCVTNITSEPSNFSNNSPLTEENKPVWGTCP